jgi:hypothetical protein
MIVDLIISVVMGAIGGALMAVAIDAIKNRGFFWNA